MRIERMALVVIALVVAGLGGCSPARDGAETGAGAMAEDEVASQPSVRDGEGEEIEHTGRVVVSGSAGMAVIALQTEGGQSVGLAGELLDELTRLSGAVVAVAGPPARTLQGEGVDVVRYEVVSVDGEKPVVGVLAGGEGAFRLESAESLALVDVPEQLAEQVGAKIWVVGPETAEGTRVRSYGVIRPTN